MSTMLIIGPIQERDLRDLWLKAHWAPVDVKTLQAPRNTAAERAAHRARMAAHTLTLPFEFRVTLLLETGHSCGPCWHMSLSAPTPCSVPAPDLVEEVAMLLSFSGGLENCVVWVEELEDYGRTVNVMQPARLKEQRAAAGHNCARLSLHAA